MTTHAELEQLSAYVDGELTQHESVAVEAHVATCAECTSVLAAIRATLAALGALDEPTPSPQDSWALRSAIAKERRIASRGKRMWWLSGAAAAVAVGILTFALVRSPATGSHLGVSDTAATTRT